MVSVFRRLKKIDQQLIYEQYRKKYNIHPDFKFNGPSILFYGKGKINCGSGSYIGTCSTIEANENCVVEIASGCAISHNVRMYTTSYDPDQDFSNPNRFVKTGNIIIQDNVWIGVNVLINPGVTIGYNSVIGANSVVTKNIEPNSICGGVPAKLIKYKSIK